ncbi:MAG: hypothetical protein HY862_21265 [Chloroflexi bacterium]|nr:hypothetical protein [Chloroflexota bacterium]
MRASSLPNRLGSMVKKIAGYELPFIVVAILVCLIRGNLTLSYLGSTLAFLGILWIGFALISGFTGNGSTRTFNYQMSASASQSIQERVSDAQNDRRQARGFVGSSLISGGIAIVIGLTLFIFFF